MRAFCVQLSQKVGLTPRAVFDWAEVLKMGAGDTSSVRGEKGARSWRPVVCRAIARGPLRSALFAPYFVAVFLFPLLL